MNIASRGAILAVDSQQRIEDEAVVTLDGNRIITKFQAEELPVCGTTYVSGADPLREKEVLV